MQSVGLGLIRGWVRVPSFKRLSFDVDDFGNTLCRFERTLEEPAIFEIGLGSPYQLNSRVEQMLCKNCPKLSTVGEN